MKLKLVKVTWHCWHCDQSHEVTIPAPSVHDAVDVVGDSVLRAYGMRLMSSRQPDGTFKMANPQRFNAEVVAENVTSGAAFATLKELLESPKSFHVNPQDLN